ncbi:MAG TPA: tetratricopeptide repeat protein [Candidatus Desulfaltia sp.]|nr:tetratricopeptide repeat protein [Candidatus Desulfaltia sp.]
MRCPRCQSDNPEGSQTCAGCGAALMTLGAAGGRAPGPQEPGATPTRTLQREIKDITSGALIAGKYKLLEELGSGGMGVVYLAEQVEPVRRRVALKIIKLGMDTRQVVARFETERQALAVMDHPNIARVFDAGATETGRPYFVMELARGIPITDYCDRHKLPARERLGLFIEVCQAVQHAHQKGVIHRDLKPSNILVVIQDDRPVPKIIDFGIAKATDHRLAQRTLFTEQGQLIGTPEYMSPEQAEMSGLDVDTRTDIYSLGVILYELLVGALPFDAGKLRSAAFGEIQRIIRETEPPKASTRLSTLKETKAEIAEKRGTDAGSLVKLLRGDLDWITMKAMAKDRTRRYSTASELGAEVERYLRHEPVTAGPPSAVYRLRKYVRRHKLGVVAAAVVMLAVLIGTAGTTIGLLRAVRAEKKALEEAATATRVSDFLVDLFKVSDPSEARGNTITAREILDRGAKKVEEELASQPAVQARLMDTMGQVFHSLGLFNQALPLLKSGLETRRKVLGNKHLEVAASLQNLGYLLIAKGDYAAAEPLLQESLTIRQELLGRNHPEVATSLATLGEVNYDKGDLAKAEEFYRESLAIRRQAFGDAHREVSDSLNDLAITLKAKGDYDEAEPMYRESLTIRRKVFGEDHPAIAQSLNNLGMFLYQMFLNKKNDGAEAEQLLRQALVLNRRILGNDHPEVATNLNNLALLLRDKGDYDQAIALFREGMELDHKNLGDEHPYVANRMNSLASVLVRKGDYKSAEVLFRQALEIQRKTFAEKSWEIATTKLLLGACYTEAKRFREAEPLILEAFPIIEKAFGISHLRTQAAVKRLIGLYEAWGKPDKAAEYVSLLKK